MGSIVLFVAVSIGAEPNALTPEEQAEGWTLVFDGHKAPRWEINGDYEIRAGQLILGGVTRTTTFLPGRLQDGSEVRLDYLVQNRQGVLALERVQSGGLLGGKGLAKGTFCYEHEEGWRQARIFLVFDPVVGALISRSEVVLVDSQQPILDSFGGLHGPAVRTLGFEVQPGSTLALRNIRAKG